MSRVGKILKDEFLDPKVINALELAEMIDIPEEDVKLIIAGRKRITPEIDKKLCKLFRLSEGYFLLLQRFDLRKVN